MFFKKQQEIQNIQGVLKKIKGLEEKIDKFSQALENMEKESKLHIQKIGVVRYNPFSNVGGDQSFSIALLDKNNNGVVITSLYAQDNNRVYGKAIENSRSEHSLSEEETKAIAKAVKN